MNRLVADIIMGELVVDLFLAAVCMGFWLGRNRRR